VLLIKKKGGKGESTVRFTQLCQNQKGKEGNNQIIALVANKITYPKSRGGRKRLLPTSRRGEGYVVLPERERFRQGPWGISRRKDGGKEE